MTATKSIADLIDRGAIVPIFIELEVDEQPMRLLYGTPDFVTWLTDRLRAAETSSISDDLSPAQQLDQIFYNFISGRPLIHSRQYRFIRAESHAVWELKTPDLRIFGWFMAKDCFVAVFGDWADKVKDFDLYRGYRLEVRRIRRELGIDQALCVKGTDPDEVLSV
jgi:hypothetical protein|nr:hypothetical protein [Methylobacterium sp. ZNC0032]